MAAPVGLILLLLVPGAWGEDTVAANVGLHTVSRIGALLSPSECRWLRRQLAGPDRDLGHQELEQLSEENPIPPHHGRRIRSPRGCSASLREWLRTEGDVVTWDRLARSLRRVGRFDIARELGKNLNQDRSLELRRNVEEYGHSVQHPSSPRLPGGERRGMRALEGQRGDLRFERRPPPRYTRSLLGWVGPVALGILGGFLTSLLFSVAAVYSCCWMLSMDAT